MFCLYTQSGFVFRFYYFQKYDRHPGDNLTFSIRPIQISFARATGRLLIYIPDCLKQRSHISFRKLKTSDEILLDQNGYEICSMTDETDIHDCSVVYW